MANMFNEDGTYNKTEWKAGDKITAAKLNKIELSLEAINNNDIDRHVEADSRLDILEERMANTPDNEQMDALEDMVKDNKDAADLAVYGINQKIESLESVNADSRLDALEGINADSRLDALEGVNADSRLDTLEGVNVDIRLNALEDKIKNKYSVNVKDFGAVGDGVTDDTLAIKNAFSFDNIEFPSGTYRVTDEISFENKNVFGSNMTHVTILGDIEDSSKAILAVGGQSVIRDITVSYADSRITGSETLYQRVGIKLYGGSRNLPFQTGAGIYNCQIRNCGTGISDGGASVFSANFKDIRISKFTCRGFEMYGTARTGNVYDNIYITNHDFTRNDGSGDSQHAWQGFVLSGEESECTITQLNVEHATLYNAVIIEDVLGFNSGSIHIEGVELRDDYLGMVQIERTQGIIHNISFYYTRHKNGTSLIKFGATKKDDTTNDFHSDNVNFEIGTLVCKGLNRPDRSTYGYEPCYPLSVSTLSGSTQPFYFISRESHPDKYFVTLNRYNWMTYNYGFDDREVYENFPCNPHDSITFLKKAHMDI